MPAFKAPKLSAGHTASSAGRHHGDPSLFRSSSSARRRPSIEPSVAASDSLRPPPTRRSRSHGGGARSPPADARRPRRDEHEQEFERPGAPRRRSTHRSSLSPHSRRESPPRGRRHADGRSHRRRESPDYSPERMPSPARGRTARETDGADRRHSSALSPPYATGGIPSPYRPGTPARYRPSSNGAAAAGAGATLRERDSLSKPAAAPAPVKAAVSPAPPVASPAPAAAPTASGGRLGGLLGTLPTTMLAYTGVKELAKHADSAKEWVDWLKDMGETPEEIEELSSKVDTARDTVAQIRKTLEARPDLLEDDQGKALKGQIEDAIKKTDKTLASMTKMVSDLGKTAGHEGTALQTASTFWNSYQYKTEFKDKIEKSDAELQKNLTALSTLMVNVYSRAILMPTVAGAKATPEAAAAATAATAAANTVAAAAPAIAAGESPAVTPVIQSPVTEVPTPAMVTPDVVDARPSEAMAVRDKGVSPSAAWGVKIPIRKAEPESPRRASEAEASNASLPAPVLEALRSGDAADRVPSPDEIAKLEENVGSPPLSKRVSVAEPGDTVPVRIASPPLVKPVLDPRRSSASRAVGISTAPEDISPRMSAAIPETVPAVVAAAVPTRTTAGSPVAVPAVAPERPAPPPAETAEEALLDAAWDGDIDDVAEALRHASVNIRDKRGLTPLHLAAERDHLAIAIMLLDRGADVDARADGGRMALHLASRFATVDTVEMLLERAGASPNARTADGRTPLHYAASAAEDGDEERREVLRVLRDWGANPTAKDRDGEMPRDVAQRREFWDAASTLRRAEKRWDEKHRQNWLQRHGLMK